MLKQKRKGGGDEKGNKKRDNLDILKLQQQIQIVPYALFFTFLALKYDKKIVYELSHNFILVLGGFSQEGGGITAQL